MKILVENLPNFVRENDFKSTFETYGRVTSAILLKDNMSGVVEMPIKSQAITAMQYLNDTEWFGEKLCLKVLREDEDRRVSKERRSMKIRRSMLDRRISADEIPKVEVIVYEAKRMNQEKRSGVDRRILNDRREKFVRRSDINRRS
ncbi:hypothetical protein E3V33_06415 [Candidatus Marinimicrobia bacterium MT.SAG.4]|nr:hypothetical protein E3V33_06415 [Candidatus Marinimicrobia bacterium MT.SAG.4]